MSALASTSAPQSGHVAGSGRRTSIANCILQPTHWPATVSRHAGDAAGRCSPSKRRALTAEPSGARPRRRPPPARAGARRRWCRTRLVCHQAGSVPRSAGLLEVGPPPVRRRREGREPGLQLRSWRQKCRHGTPRVDASPSSRRRRPAWAATPATTPGTHVGTDPAAQRQGRGQERPAGFPVPHGGSLRRRQWANGAGRARAGGQVLAHAAGRRPAINVVAGAKPAPDGRRGNAATDHPRARSVPDAGVGNRGRL